MSTKNKSKAKASSNLKHFGVNSVIKCEISVISSIYDTKFGKRNEWTNLRIVHLSSLKWLIKEMRSQRGRGQGKRASEWEWKTKTLLRSKMWAKVYLLRWVKGSGLPAIPWLGVYPEETIIEKDKCTPVFTATLFTIARTWKQPRCPSTDV